MEEKKKPVEVSGIEGTVRFGPFVVSFSKEKSSPQEKAESEIIRLRQRVEELEAEIERLKGEKRGEY